VTGRPLPGSTARLSVRRVGRPGSSAGGYYNPEQWDEPAWKEDDEIMRRARVNLAVDLATPTASPPPWFTLARLPQRGPPDRLRPGRAIRRPPRPRTVARAQRVRSRSATATTRPRPSGCGCVPATDRWTPSTTRGGRPSGVSDTPPGSRYCRRVRRSGTRTPGQALDFHHFWADEIIAAYRQQRDAIRAHSDRPVTGPARSSARPKRQTGGPGWSSPPTPNTVRRPETIAERDQARP
jgi:beta-galactosidase